MRAKYVQERFPRYFIFGEHSDGKVDIATVEDSTICTVTHDEACVLVEQRDEILEILTLLAIEFDKIAPAKFAELWYEKNNVKTQDKW